MSVDRKAPRGYRKAWNGGSREAALEAAGRRRIAAAMAPAHGVRLTAAALAQLVAAQAPDTLAVLAEYAIGLGDEQLVPLILSATMIEATGGELRAALAATTPEPTR